MFNFFKEWRRVGRTAVGVSLAAILVTGCARNSSRLTTPAGRAAGALSAAPTNIYDDARAAALVFDPPATFGERPLDLSREGREPAAYLGYEELNTTFSYVRTEDVQAGGSTIGDGRFQNFYERRAVQEKVGVLVR